MFITVNVLTQLKCFILVGQKVHTISDCSRRGSHFVEPVLHALRLLFLYALHRFFDSLARPGTYSVRHPLGICLIDATRTLSTKHL